MAKKKVFISFDYDHDRHYRYLLNAMAENPRLDIQFSDSTPGEIDSDDVSRIKAVLTQKIRQSTITIVLIGNYANSYHKDRAKIGYRNWQWWEIEKSYEEGNRLIAVKIDRNYDSPEPLHNKGAIWVYSFNVDDIAKAIDKA